MFRDNQEAFDVALSHMRTQGKRAMRLIRGPGGPKTMCVYRGNNNERCGVGALIPDSLYNPEFEGKLAMAVCNYPTLRGWFRNVNIDVLQDIQGAHDHALDHNFLYTMEQNMMHVASKWGLRYRGPADEFNAPLPESFLEYLRMSSQGASGWDDEMTYYEPGPFDLLPKPTVKDICPAEKLKANPKQFYF